MDDGMVLVSLSQVMIEMKNVLHAYGATYLPLGTQAITSHTLVQSHYVHQSWFFSGCMCVCVCVCLTECRSNGM